MEGAEAQQSSFLSLPKELCLKCMCAFDWASLGRAMCASRELRALVSGRAGRAAARCRRRGRGRTVCSAAPRGGPPTATAAAPLQAQYILRQPYFITRVEEQPAVLITEFQSPADRAAACERWVVS